MEHPVAVTQTSIPDQSRRVLSCLRRLLKEQTTGNYQACARETASLRSLVVYEGRPDWRGQSPEYKDRISHLYRMAEMPSDSQGNIQANLRYHVGNAVRELAPDYDIEALGLSKDSPLDRARKSRSKARSTDETSPAALVASALRQLRTARSAGVTADMAPSLGKIIREATDALADLVD
jgi:hypothetical protein